MPLKTFPKQVIFRFAVGIVLFLLVAVTGLVTAYRYVESEKWVAHTYQVIGIVESITGLISQIESAQRGFVITGREEILAPYWTGMAASQNKLEHLEILVSDNSEQLERVRELRRIVDEKMKNMAKHIDQRRNGVVIKGAESLDEGPALMDRVGTLVDKISLEERKLLAQRREVARFWLYFSWLADVLLFTVALLLVWGAFVRAAQALREQISVSQELKEKTGILTAFVQYAPVSIAIFDREMNFLSVSDEWCRLFNKPREEVLNKNAYVAFPDLPDGWRDDHVVVIQKGRKIVSPEEVIQIDGMNFSIDRILVPWVKEDRIAGLISFARDVTTEKTYKAELNRIRELVDELESQKTGLLAEISSKANEHVVSPPQL